MVEDKRVSGDLVWRWICVFTAEDKRVNFSWHTCWRHWQKRLKHLSAWGQYSYMDLSSSWRRCSTLSGYPFLLFAEKTLVISSKIKTSSLGRSFPNFRVCLKTFGIQTWNLSKLLRIKLHVTDIVSLWRKIQSTLPLIKPIKTNSIISKAIDIFGKTLICFLAKTICLLYMKLEFSYLTLGKKAN